ncbi:TadE/TadG family type IV pilus assembly protein [Vibrio sp. Vb2135]|uniref:TadE/TadG family type IV pilus assembly protein n=1 Tax=Vibrio sp. Vb2135 TaxID=3074653 RepID=UPI002964FA10|nr:TadE/TadG family type IV pilus assembly protein [Vibrio sp. Vb2135]MDW1765643.1 TadE/TadG family type IV pilus assembly protein [Vibrio sp. Vb2135]
MKQYCRLHRQSGHAAILFALFIPLLFGVFTLGTDGARAVQDKARLLEAVEVASLAVAGQGSDNADLAKNYLEYYFPSATINNNDIKIKKINCEDNADCKNRNRRFFEYQVSAKISQPTWFPGNDAIIGFGENYSVGGHSSARKFHAETVDVVLVADFSGSMAWRWDKDGSQNSANPVRYIMMKDIISEIADELKKFNQYVQVGNKNRLAITGFDYFTSQLIGENKNKMGHFDHLICDGGQRCSINCRYSWWGGLNCGTVPGSNADNVDAEATVKNIFNLAHWSHSEPILKTNKSLSLSYFSDIELTDNFSRFKELISNYYIKGSGISGTSSYSGIIRGAQIAQSGSNSRRLIIILSDGQDSYRATTQKLIRKGLCSTILNVLNSQKNTQARMVAVGFAYDINAFPEMKNCVGEENVFSAKNRDDIKNKILELITEEIGHLAL